MKKGILPLVPWLDIYLGNRLVDIPYVSDGESTAGQSALPRFSGTKTVSVPWATWIPQMVIGLSTLIIIHPRALLISKETPSKKSVE